MIRYGSFSEIARDVLGGEDCKVNVGLQKNVQGGRRKKSLLHVGQQHMLSFWHTQSAVDDGTAISVPITRRRGQRKDAVLYRDRRLCSSPSIRGQQRRGGGPDKVSRFVSSAPRNTPRCRRGSQARDDSPAC